MILIKIYLHHSPLPVPPSNSSHGFPSHSVKQMASFTLIVIHMHTNTHPSESIYCGLCVHDFRADHFLLAAQQ